MSTTNELELIRVVATAIINGRRRLGIRELLSATVSRSIRVGYCVVCVCGGDGAGGWGGGKGGLRHPLPPCRAPLPFLPLTSAVLTRGVMAEEMAALGLHGGKRRKDEGRKESTQQAKGQCWAGGG